MSYEAMHRVRACGLTDRTLVDVLASLAFFLNQESGLCFPSTDSIARVARLSPNIVRRAVKDLETAGYISTYQKPGGRRNFHLHLDKLPDGDDSTQPLSEMEGVSHQEGVSEVKGVSEVTPLPCQKRDPSPVRSERGPLSEVKAEQGNNKEFNREEEQGSLPERTPWETDLLTNDGKKIEKPKKTTPRLVKPEGVSDEVWTEWTAHKRKVCKSCSQRAVDNIVREAAKAGMTVEEAMIYQLEKGWKGFEADWVTDNRPNKRSTNIRFEGHDNDFSCIYG